MSCNLVLMVNHDVMQSGVAGEAWYAIWYWWWIMISHWLMISCTLVLMLNHNATQSGWIIMPRNLVLMVNHDIMQSSVDADSWYHAVWCWCWIMICSLVLMVNHDMQSGVDGESWYHAVWRNGELCWQWLQVFVYLSSFFCLIVDSFTFQTYMTYLLVDTQILKSLSVWLHLTTVCIFRLCWPHRAARQSQVHVPSHRHGCARL